MQHPALEQVQNYETKGATKKLSIAKLNWVVEAARLGAAHPTGSNTPRNDPIALHSKGQLCRGGLRRDKAPTVTAPCPGNNGSWSPSPVPVAFPGIFTFQWGHELLLLLLPRSGIGSSPCSQDAGVLASGWDVGLQSRIPSSRSPAPWAPPALWRLPLAGGSRVMPSGPGNFYPSFQLPDQLQG